MITASDGTLASSADVSAWLARRIASDGPRRLFGATHNIQPYPQADEPAGKINVTDPDSRSLEMSRGWVQGYNAQAVVTLERIVIVADISTESLDTAQPATDDRNRRQRTAGGRDVRTGGDRVGRRGLLANDAIDALLGQGIGS